MIEIVNDYVSRKMFNDIIVTSAQKENLLKLVEKHGKTVFKKNKSALKNHAIYVTIPKMVRHRVITITENLDMLLKVQPNSYDHFVLLYGDDAYQKWDEKHQLCSTSLTGFQKRHGIEKGTLKYNTFRKKKENSNTLDWYVDKYGKEEGTKKFNEYSDRQRYTNTIDYYIEKYGPEMGESLYYVRYPKPDYDLKEYADYKKAVYRLSNQIYNENKNKINPHNHKRTLMGVEGGWQLDHVKPVYECFKDGVSIEEAADINNLRMLPWKDNLMRNFNAKS